MYKYNFKTKVLSTIFDNVKFFVFSSSILNIRTLPTELFCVIEYKGMVCLALEAHLVEEFQITKIYDTNNSGKCILFGNAYSWSLQDGDKIFLSNGI